MSVVAASKNTVSSSLPRAAARSVVHRSTPCVRASCSTLAAFRPTRIGSGMTRSPFESATPPSSMILSTERTRCWLVPMRPVTPFMMMPSRVWAIFHPSGSAATARRRRPSGRRQSRQPCKQHARPACRQFFRSRAPTISDEAGTAPEVLRGARAGTSDTPTEGAEGPVPRNLRWRRTTWRARPDLVCWASATYDRESWQTRFR